MYTTKQQKPQQSRILLNVKAIQKYMGKNDSTIICNAKIKYSHKKGKKNTVTTAHGCGGSDANTAQEVNTLFTTYGLTSLAKISKANAGNPPGQCAEPHAVADALKEIDKRERFVINRIVVYDARVNNLTNSLIKQGKNRGDVMPRCETCKQWVPNNHVIEKYLK